MLKPLSFQPHFGLIIKSYPDGQNGLSLSIALRNYHQVDNPEEIYNVRPFPREQVTYYLTNPDKKWLQQKLSSLRHVTVNKIQSCCEEVFKNSTNAFLVNPAELRRAGNFPNRAEWKSYFERATGVSGGPNIDTPRPKAKPRQR